MNFGHESWPKIFFFVFEILARRFNIGYRSLKWYLIQIYRNNELFIIYISWLMIHESLKPNFERVHRCAQTFFWFIWGKMIRSFVWYGLKSCAKLCLKNSWPNSWWLGSKKKISKIWNLETKKPMCANSQIN